MIRYVQETKPASFHATDLGRIASHFYINYSTIEVACLCSVECACVLINKLLSRVGVCTLFYILAT